MTSKQKSGQEKQRKYGEDKKECKVNSGIKLDGRANK